MASPLYDVLGSIPTLSDILQFIQSAIFLPYPSIERIEPFGKVPERGLSVVVDIARNCGSSTTSNVFCRKIDGSGSAKGKTFQLQTLENSSFWKNEEVTNGKLKVGCILEYQIQTHFAESEGRFIELFFFRRNVCCERKHQPRLNTSPLIRCCVVVAIAQNCGSSTTSNVFCRKINSSGTSAGRHFQLQKLENRSFWRNEEVTKKRLKVGCLLEYQVESSCQSHLGRSRKLFIFFRNVCCKPQHQPGLNTSPLIPNCGRCVVVAIARNCGSSTTSNVFCRKINSSESGEGEPFQLQKLKNRSFWTNEEVTKKGLKVGCCLEYQVESSCQSHLGRSSKLFIFCGNVSCKPQDVDKILLDLQDDGSVYGGLKEAHECFNLEFHRLQAHSACARIFFIGIRAGTINNERITLETISGEWSEMPLNCRESLVLSTEPVHLQLKRPWDVADDVVGGVAVVKFDEARKATCEGLISRYKPLVISRDEEPVEMRNEFGEVIPVPGHWRVLFDTGNEVATGISRELLLKLNLQPDPNKKRKAKLAGRRSGQFETIQIVLAIRGYQFSVCALVDVPAKGTDLLVGMDVIQQLFDLGYTIGD